MLTGTLVRGDPGELTDPELQTLVTSPRARCVNPAIHPDEWFPLASEPAKAREQASAALALCAACPVRAACLELALRHWRGAGQHGIWGGTLATERAALRPMWLAGAKVSDLLQGRRWAGPR